MAKYRCPRCGAIFEGKTDRCPRCNVLFKFNKEDSDSPEYAIAERKEEEKPQEQLPVAQEEPKAEIREVVVEKEVPVVVEKAIIPENTKENTYFDGKMIQWLGWTLLGCLVTLVTLGFFYPLAMVWMQKWEAKHTVINGYRLRLDANPWSLVGRWILWELLTLITVGIFGLWVPTKLLRWKTARMTMVFDKPAEEEKEEPQEEAK